MLIMFIIMLRVTFELDWVVRGMLMLWVTQGCSMVISAK